VSKVVAAHDVGRAINPSPSKAKSEGGEPGLAWHSMEEFFPGKSGNLHDYLIPTIGDIPPIESILIETRPLSARSAQKVSANKP